MPYLILTGAEQFIAMLTDVFDGEEHVRITRDDKSIQHAEVQIGDANVMVSEATGDFQNQTAGMFIYVDSADDRYEKAIAAGCESVMPPHDETYAKRAAGFRDSFGNFWWLASF